MVQVKYAEIEMMIQDKNILFLPPIVREIIPLFCVVTDFCNVDFRQSIQNLSSLRALLCIPYSGRLQQLSLGFFGKVLESRADTANSFELILLH